MTVQKNEMEHVPDFEKLAAWRDGTLAAEEREKFGSHVEACEECRDFLLLTSGEAEEERDPKIADFQKAATWRAVRSEIRAIEAREDMATAERKAALAQERHRAERWSLIAACLLLVLPLGSWGARQAKTLDQLTQPQMNVAIHDVLEIVPRGSDTDADAPPAVPPDVFEVPAGTEFFTLTLPISGDHDLYRVQIHDHNGHLVWSGEGLEVDPFGVATLGLSRHFLAAGFYRLDVEGRHEDGEYEVIGSSTLDVRYR